ncbi:MAG: MlaD family protein [Campylobacter sp.]|nr:MlaD family protein [Campylobacter sp.]
MENRNSYTIVGMFFIFCMSAFAIFIWWMTNNDGTKLEYKNYYIHTSELPSGLKVDSQVKFIGVPAGSVSKIDFVKDNKSALIEITIKVRDDVPVRKDSLASIEVQAISGVASINISRGTQEFTKDERPILNLEQSLLSKLGTNAQSITEQLNQTLAKIDGFFSPENIKHLESILANIDRFTEVLADEDGISKADAIVSNIKKFTDDLNQTDTKRVVENLNTLLVNTNLVAKSLNTAVIDYKGVQNLVKTKLEKGEYDLKNTLTPMLLEATEFFGSFEKTLREFRGALYRLEDNPYEFFFKNPILNSQKDGDKK